MRRGTKRIRLLRTWGPRHICPSIDPRPPGSQDLRKTFFNTLLGWRRRKTLKAINVVMAEENCPETSKQVTLQRLGKKSASISSVGQCTTIEIPSVLTRSLIKNIGCRYGETFDGRILCCARAICSFFADFSLSTKHFKLNICTYYVFIRLWMTAWWQDGAGVL